MTFEFHDSSTKLKSAVVYSVPYNEPINGPNAAIRNLVATAR
jgi:hypothetical protein